MSYEASLSPFYLYSEAAANCSVRSHTVFVRSMLGSTKTVWDRTCVSSTNNNNNNNNNRSPAITLEGLFRRLYEATPQGQNPVLPIQGQAYLAPYVHSDAGLRELAQHGQPVPFIRGRISARQIQYHRPSYINALLIQSRGVRLARPCTHCRGGQGLRRPFPECRHIPGEWEGACANCKWPDRANQCSVRDVLWENLGEQRPGLPAGGQGGLGEAANRPINLDPEEGEEEEEEGDEDNPIIL